MLLPGLTYWRLPARAVAHLLLPTDDELAALSAAELELERADLGPEAGQLKTLASKVRALIPGGRSSITADELAESHWDDCDREAFDRSWQTEADDLATRPYTERFYLATGRLLPIWNLLGDDAQVRRLVTLDGRSVLGRIVPAEAVNMLLDKLGIGDRIALSPEQVVEAALGGTVVPIDALSGTSLKRSRVNGEQRLEVIGFDPRALPSWKAKGCFTEIIQYQTRLFMPVNQANEIVAKLAA